MVEHPLSSPKDYEQFLYSLPARFPSIKRSTLVYVPSGALFGSVEGLLIFNDDIVLCVQEYLNFELGVIEGYAYEVSRSGIDTKSAEFPAAHEFCKASFATKEKLYWYDSFPHPNNPELAATHPHHKHIPPEIKHNRIPAPELSFSQPNLPT